MNECMLAQAAAKHSLQDKITTLTKGNRQLATLWGFVQEVRRVARAPNLGSKDLAKIISSDPVISTRLLRTVSSAAYGFPSEIASLDQAIVLLGSKAVINLCTSIQALRCLSGKDRSFDRVALWRHSLATAMVSRTLQSTLFKTADPELFTAGLLCNMGRICIDQLMPAEFDQILKRAKNMTMLEAEVDVLGATHAEVGAWIASSWNIDPRLCRTMELHHGPAGLDKWAMVVNLAYVYVHAMGVGSPGEARLTPLAPGCLGALGLDSDKLKNLIPKMNRAIAEAEPMLKIMVEK